MEIIACTCEEGLGLPHTHVGTMYVLQNGEKTIRLRQHDYKLNYMGLAERGFHCVKTEEPYILAWINWKEVARAVMTP